MSSVSLARGQGALDSGAAPAFTTTALHAWPELHPLRRALLTQPYPLHALPNALRAAVLEVQQFTQAPVSLVACSALASLSLVGQALADVRRAEGLTGPVGLFTLVIAESGERKSSSDGYFRRPIDQYERDQLDACKPLVVEYDKQMAAWEARVAGIKDRIRKLSRTGEPTETAEDELACLYTRKPDRPRIPRIAYGDVTPEALAFGLATQWPSGGILSAEAGSVLGGHAMNSESVMRNMALLNTLWDGGRHHVDRRTSESFVVDAVRLTIGLQVQPQTLLSFFAKNGELARGIGFMARFLIAWPDSTQGTRFFSEPPRSWPALGQLNTRIRQLLDTPVNIEHGALFPPVLALSPPAQSAWIEIHDAIESELTRVGELATIRDVASKAADNVARLAGLFHLLRTGPTAAIMAEDVVNASKIVTWHLQEAKRFFALAEPDIELGRAEELDRFLIRWCRRTKESSVSVRDVQQRANAALRDRAVLDDALSELVALGRVRLRDVGRQCLIDLHPQLLPGQE